MKPITATSCLICIAFFGCSPNTPSSGQCLGSIEDEKIDEPLIAEESYFYRDDQDNMVEHAFVEMTFGQMDGEFPKLRIEAHFADMPSEEHQGDHELPLPRKEAGYINSWDVTVPAIAYSSGSMQITAATRQAIEGSFTMTFADDTNVECEVRLSRNYDMDTDD